MAQQKGQKKQDVEKKDLTHSVAIVTNRNFKDIYNKKVAIEEVNNGIAKVQELESDDICYYYVPLRWLKVLSDKETIEAYKENCGRMLDELLDGSGDLVKRMFEQIVEGKIEYDKDDPENKIYVYVYGVPVALVCDVVQDGENCVLIDQVGEYVANIKKMYLNKLKGKEML